MQQREERWEMRGRKEKKERHRERLGRERERERKREKRCKHPLQFFSHQSTSFLFAFISKGTM